MNNNLAIFALRLIPKKKQQTMLVRALNYLFDNIDLSSYDSTVIAINIRDTKLHWVVLFDGQGFIPTNQMADVSITMTFDDVIHFPSREQIKEKLNNSDIDIQGSDQYQYVAVELLEKVDQLKITACIRYLRKMVGLKEQNIRDKELSALTIRDIASEADVNYVRDQALNQERVNPVLAYRLMALAHGARPNGPFIKRKLDEYRKQGLERQAILHGKPRLQAIEIAKKEVAYFPIPKAACSSIKSALYQLRNGRQFDKSNYDNRHVHDYWIGRQKPLDSFENKIIVVRDPIERFLSAYASRVHDHGELNRAAIEKDCPWLAKKLPHFKPNLNQFITHLDKYMLVPVIDHHCKPLIGHVNGDLSTFTHVFPIEDIGEFEAYLQSVTGSELSIPNTHISRHKVPLARLSREQLDFLFDYFDDDYRMLARWYSKERVLAKWKASRSESCVA